MQQATIDHIHTVLDELKPMIHRDGGDIEFVEYSNTIVYIRFKGACVGCPMSAFTLKMGIEEALKTRIPEITSVCAVTD